MSEPRTTRATFKSLVNDVVANLQRELDRNRRVRCLVWLDRWLVKNAGSGFASPSCHRQVERMRDDYFAVETKTGAECLIAFESLVFTALPPLQDELSDLFEAMLTECGVELDENERWGDVDEESRKQPEAV